MGFTTMSGNALEIIDHIASEMIATGGWEDADAEFTTAGTPPGRVLRYKRDGEELFIAFVAVNWWGSNYSYSGNYGAKEMGIICYVSSGWDAGEHIPAGSVSCARMPMRSNSLSGGPPAGFTQCLAQIWMYSEGDITAILSSTGTSSDRDPIYMLTIEREAAKEYDDGGSNFFIYSTAQSGGYGYTSSTAIRECGVAPYVWSMPANWSPFRLPFRRYIHPFVSEYPLNADSSTHNFEDGNDVASTKLTVPVRASRSNGNSKVYMAFPVAYADAGDNVFRTPIKTLKAFFPVMPNAGIADGDLINIPVSWNGGVPTTWQYIYKQLVSPDGGVLDVAIKYGEV